MSLELRECEGVVYATSSMLAVSNVEVALCEVKETIVGDERHR